MTSKPHPDFEQQEDLIYLNHAAVAPWPQRSAEAVKNFAQENLQCGTFYYSNWLEKELRLREQLRQLINAPSKDDIALVKNTSEALSFVAYGIDWNDGDNIVSSNEEFPSNRIPWQSLSNQGVEFREADLKHSSSAEDALFELVDRNTRLLTISSVQFASGLRVNLEKLGKFCKQRDILFCVDAIQSIGAVRFDVQACQADFVMADGHKWMLGPEGLGLFYTTEEARNRLNLNQYGWHMVENLNNYANQPWEVAHTSRRFECGSTNLLGVHALSASLSLLLETGMDNVENAILEKVSYLKQAINASRQLTLLNPANTGLGSGIVLFRHNEIENEALFNTLRKNKVICAKRGSGIRFSPHFYNTTEQLQKALAVSCGE